MEIIYFLLVFILCAVVAFNALFVIVLVKITKEERKNRRLGDW